MPAGPTEELKNCDFHPGTLYLVYDSKIGWQDPERKASSFIPALVSPRPPAAQSVEDSRPREAETWLTTV